MIGVNISNSHIKQYFVVLFGYSVNMKDKKVKTVVLWAICWLRFENQRQLKNCASDGFESKPVSQMSAYFNKKINFYVLEPNAYTRVFDI